MFVAHGVGDGNRVKYGIVLVYTAAIKRPRALCKLDNRAVQTQSSTLFGGGGGDKPTRPLVGFHFDCDFLRRIHNFESKSPPNGVSALAREFSVR